MTTVPMLCLALPRMVISTPIDHLTDQTDQHTAVIVQNYIKQQNIWQMVY